MTPSSAALTTLSRMLTAELDSARELLETLDFEHQALLQGDMEGVGAASGRKLQQMRRMQRLLIERDRFLIGNQFQPGKPGTDAMLASLGAESPVLAHWKELQGLAVRLRDSNDVNGGIVAQERRHVRQALDILTGRSGDDHTYTVDGTRKDGNRTNTLAKA